MNARDGFRLSGVVEALAPFAAGLLLLASGAWSAARQFGCNLPPGPLETSSLMSALLVAGAGAAVVVAAWELVQLRRSASGAQAAAERAKAERDLALLQARRMRAQAEGLALMREIHRSTALPQRHDRLHRILTLVGDLFEAREVALFAAGAYPWPVLPAACLKANYREEIFVSFDTEALAGALAASPKAPPGGWQVRDGTIAWVGCWLCLEGQVTAGQHVVGRVQTRLSANAQEEGTPPRNPSEMLAAFLSQLDLGSRVCRQAAAALSQRRALRQREASSIRRQEAGDEALVLHVPLLADQRPVGALRIRRQAEGFDGPAAEAVEEMLIESAKHIALAMKKDEDDRKAITDQLTGLFIKRHMLEVLEQLRAEAAATGKSFALLLCDLDHFKQVNDAHGHPTGDLVLQKVAQSLRSALRAGDLAFRYGGEELAVLMPGATQASSLQTAERLRAAVQSAKLTTDRGQPLQATISLGLALHQAGLSAAELIARADRALYASKHAGRNRVTAWRPDLRALAPEAVVPAVS
jgi:diguanylate cyclase (GGDEF)-like protein